MDVTRLEKQVAELSATLQTRLTDYGRLQILTKLCKLLEQLNNIYKHQLERINKNGNTNN